VLKCTFTLLVFLQVDGSDPDQAATIALYTSGSALKLISLDSLLQDNMDSVSHHWSLQEHQLLGEAALQSLQQHSKIMHISAGARQPMSSLSVCTPSKKRSALSIPIQSLLNHEFPGLPDLHPQVHTLSDFLLYPQPASLVAKQHRDWLSQVGALGSTHSSNLPQGNYHRQTARQSDDAGDPDYQPPPDYDDDQDDWSSDSNYDSDSSSGSSTKSRSCSDDDGDGDYYDSSDESVHDQELDTDLSDHSPLANKHTFSTFEGLMNREHPPVCVLISDTEAVMQDCDSEGEQCAHA